MLNALKTRGRTGIFRKSSEIDVNKDGRTGSIAEPLPTRLFRLRLEKLQILRGRSESASADAALAHLQTMLGSLPLANVNLAPHADEIRNFIANPAVWSPLHDAKVHHLSHIIAPLLRFSISGTFAELQFENLTEQLALAHLKVDTDEIKRMRERIEENLRLLPTDLPEVRLHREALAFALSAGFWQHLDYARITALQATFAPLMRFRSRRDNGQIVRLNLPDSVTQRHWIVFGPGGEGAFAENYRTQVEALVLSLAEDNPALQALKAGHDLTDEELESIARLLGGPDLFVSESRLREAFDQPEASFADFLRHILGVAKLPSREEKISGAFDSWVRRHPQLSATQLMFVRTLRRAVLQRAELASLDALRRPPFNSIGDPETLFTPNDLREVLELAQTLVA